MIIKSFAAESAAAALKMVKSEMGGDAVILKTRRLSNDSRGSLIEVTACLEKASVAQASRVLEPTTEPKVQPVERSAAVAEEAAPPTASEPSADQVVDDLSTRFARLERRLVDLNGSSQKAISAQLSAMMKDFGARIISPETGGDSDAASYRLERSLRDADVPETFAMAFLTGLQQEELQNDDMLLAEARRHMVESLAGMMQPSLELNAGDTVMVLGPSGAGKTSLLGKLAAYLTTVERKKVRLLSLDRTKVGAHDEIASYAELLGLTTAEPVVEGAPSVSEDASAVTLIDTPGLPVEDQQLQAYIGLLSAVEADYRIAVFAATTRAADVESLAARLRVLDPTHVAVTMLDMTYRHGAIIAACDSMGRKLVYTSDAPGGHGKLNAPDPSRTAGLLIPMEAGHETA